MDQLKNLLESEKSSTKILEDEYNKKIERLKNSIATASEGTKAQLMEQLKAEMASRASLLAKQTNLEIEVKQLKNQLKEEEQKAKELEEETKKKEAEKKKLDQIHRLKMRELKKKLLDSMLEQESLAKKINEEVAQQALLGIYIHTFSL